MDIRKATQDDAESLARLRINQLIDEGYSLQNKSIDSAVNEMKTYFYKNIKTNNYISWIAVDKERIIATSGLCFYELPPSFSNPTGKIAYITCMYTVPEYRKRGLATSLIRKIIETAESMGYTVIRLHASECGKTLYEKFGFKDVENDMALRI